MLGGYGSLVAESSKEEEWPWQPQSSESATSAGRWRGIWSAAASPSSSLRRTKPMQQRSRKSWVASVEEAITDAVVFAVWLDTIKELTAKDADLLEGKVVVDPSNPIGIDENGEMTRTLPDDQSAGSVVAAMLPTGAHYVKAFGTLGADSLTSAANRDPRRAVLLYATDDDTAAAAIERLISAAGFDPLKGGGVADAGRIEVPGGDLHQNGGLNGQLLDLDQARAAVATAPLPATHDDPERGEAEVNERVGLRAGA
jgi:predicted dinucleotide-binding enzyme